MINICHISVFGMMASLSHCQITYCKKDSECPSFTRFKQYCHPIGKYSGMCRPKGQHFRSKAISPGGMSEMDYQYFPISLCLDHFNQNKGNHFLIETGNPSGKIWHFCLLHIGMVQLQLYLYYLKTKKLRLIQISRNSSNYLVPLLSYNLHIIITLFL